MFQIITTPIQPEISKIKSLYDTMAYGSILEFSGKIRNHNNDRNVLALEYSCYKELAIKEGNRILQKNKDAFHLAEVIAIHRIGKLELGEIALYIALFAKHRKDSFLAMDHIIAEIKESVPIWKKEFYQKDNATWI